MGTDFIDDGLLESTQPEGSDSGASRLNRQKERITGKVADTAEEIELLKMRQAELEHEKKHLEEVNRKQNEYADGKKELIENLSRNIITMDKDEVKANRMVELLSASRSRFKAMLAEIREIREENWSEKDFEEELDKALALIESARMEYNQAIAKVDAENWGNAGGKPAASGLAPAGGNPADFGFFFWLKAGIALFLPLILVLLSIFAAYVWLFGG